MAKGKKYYVIWKGKTPGIYESWEDCQSQTKGFIGAQFKSFKSKEIAQKAFELGYEASKKTEIKPDYHSIPNGPIMPSISVDAACAGNPGLMEYQGVDTATGKRIFHRGPYEEGTNNIGEFLGLVHALALLKQKKSQLPIYTDSITAIAWVKNKKAKSKLLQTDKNKELFDLISRAETWLHNNSFQTRILKWETKVWGEIPADFGRK